MVNDNYGHEFGDELIKSAAKIIDDSFGHFGKSYRIGGDEFCVLVTGDDLEEKYERALTVFYNLINESNRKKLCVCDIQIAHGFASCTKITKEKIEEAIAIADNEMYRNKTDLKRNALKKNA